MVREARAAIRAHRGEPRGARHAEAQGKRDRGAHRQQGASAEGRGHDILASLAFRSVLGAVRRPPLGHEAPEGPHEGAAVQRGEADGYRRPLADDEAAARARGRRPQVATHKPVSRGYRRGMNPTKLDHVAYWVAERDAVADFVTAHLGMHVIDRTDTFTLVGSEARRGKLTLFAADGPRERGALQHVALRVSSLDDARAALPASLIVDSP